MGSVFNVLSSANLKDFVDGDAAQPPVAPTPAQTQSQPQAYPGYPNSSYGGGFVAPFGGGGSASASGTTQQQQQSHFQPQLQLQQQQGAPQHQIHNDQMSLHRPGMSHMSNTPRNPGAESGPRAVGATAPLPVGPWGAGSPNKSSSSSGYNGVNNNSAPGPNEGNVPGQVSADRSGLNSISNRTPAAGLTVMTQREVPDSIQANPQAYSYPASGSSSPFPQSSNHTSAAFQNKGSYFGGYNSGGNAGGGVGQDGGGRMGVDHMIASREGCSRSQDSKGSVVGEGMAATIASPDHPVPTGTPSSSPHPQKRHRDSLDSPGKPSQPPEQEKDSTKTGKAQGSVEDDNPSGGGIMSAVSTYCHRA